MINLATAEPNELKTYAKNELDISLSLAMSRDTMVEKILSTCKALNIEAPESKIELPSNKKTTVKMVTVNVAKQPFKGGADPVFVGYQGRGFLIPRGIAVSIPFAVEQILANAKQDIITQDADGERHTEEVMTYPYQVIAA